MGVLSAPVIGRYVQADSRKGSVVSYGLLHLLAREHAAGRIPDNLATLMGDIAKYLGDAASNIPAVMRQPLAAAGIKLRQEVFLDLEKPEVLEYLSALKLMLQDLENRYNTYHYQRHPFYKATAFLSLAEQYFAFVETACSGLPETVTAGLLRDFSSSFAAVKASLEYLRFKADGEKLRQALRSTAQCMG